MSYKALKDLYDLNKPLAFDLDNTIFDEYEFLSKCYKKIWKSIYGNNYELPYKFLCENFKLNGRKKLFNKLLKKFPSKSDVEDCLLILRNSSFEEEINVLPWFESFMQLTKKPFHLRIITNGNESQQRNKIKSLSLKKYELRLEVIYACKYGGKPDPRAFFALNNSKDLTDLIFIGDSETDKLFCKNSNITFLNVNNFL